MQDHFPAGILKIHVQHAGAALAGRRACFLRAVDLDVFNLTAKAFQQGQPHPGKFRHGPVRAAVFIAAVDLAIVRGNLRRAAEADDGRHVLRAGPAAGFLSAADDERRDADALSGAAARAGAGGVFVYEKRAAALWSVDLVAADRDQIRFRRQGHFAETLHGVAVQKSRRAVLLHKFLHGADRHDGADLVVDVHDADQNRPLVDGRRHLLHIRIAEPIHADANHVEAFRFKPADTLQHRRMFHGGGHDAVSAPVEGFCSTEDRHVVGFGAAGCENHIPIRCGKSLPVDGTAPSRCRQHLAARSLDGLLRVHTHLVEGRRIAIVFLHRADHHVRHFVKLSCRCTVI